MQPEGKSQNGEGKKVVFPLFDDSPWKNKSTGWGVNQFSPLALAARAQDAPRTPSFTPSPFLTPSRPNNTNAAFNTSNAGIHSIPSLSANPMFQSYPSTPANLNTPLGRSPSLPAQSPFRNPVPHKHSTSIITPAPKRSFHQALDVDRDQMQTDSPSASLSSILGPSLSPASPSRDAPVTKRARFESQPATPTIGGYNSLAVTQKIMSALKKPTALQSLLAKRNELKRKNDEDLEQISQHVALASHKRPRLLSHLGRGSGGLEPSSFFASPTAGRRERERLGEKEGRDGVGRFPRPIELEGFAPDTSNNSSGDASGDESSGALERTRKSVNVRGEREKESSNNNGNLYKARGNNNARTTNNSNSSNNSNAATGLFQLADNTTTPSTTNAKSDSTKSSDLPTGKTSTNANDLPQSKIFNFFSTTNNTTNNSNANSLSKSVNSLTNNHSSGAASDIFKTSKSSTASDSEPLKITSAFDFGPKTTATKSLNSSSETINNNNNSQKAAKTTAAAKSTTQSVLKFNPIVESNKTQRLSANNNTQQPKSNNSKKFASVSAEEDYVEEVYDENDYDADDYVDYYDDQQHGDAGDEWISESEAGPDSGDEQHVQHEEASEKEASREEGDAVPVNRTEEPSSDYWVSSDEAGDSLEEVDGETDGEEKALPVQAKKQPPVLVIESDSGDDKKESELAQEAEEKRRAEELRVQEEKKKQEEQERKEAERKQVEEEEQKRKQEQQLADEKARADAEAKRKEEELKKAKEQQEEQERKQKAEAEEAERKRVEAEEAKKRQEKEEADRLKKEKLQERLEQERQKSAQMVVEKEKETEIAATATATTAATTASTTSTISAPTFPATFNFTAPSFPVATAASVLSTLTSVTTPSTTTTASLPTSNAFPTFDFPTAATTATFTPTVASSSLFASPTSPTSPSKKKAFDLEFTTPLEINWGTSKTDAEKEKEKGKAKKTGVSFEVRPDNIDTSLFSGNASFTSVSWKSTTTSTTSTSLPSTGSLFTPTSATNSGMFSNAPFATTAASATAGGAGGFKFDVETPKSPSSGGAFAFSFTSTALPTFNAPTTTAASGTASSVTAAPSVFVFGSDENENAPSTTTTTATTTAKTAATTTAGPKLKGASPFNFATPISLGGTGGGFPSFTPTDSATNSNSNPSGSLFNMSAAPTFSFNNNNSSNASSASSNNNSGSAPTGFAGIFGPSTTNIFANSNTAATSGPALPFSVTGFPVFEQSASQTSRFEDLTESAPKIGQKVKKGGPF